MTRGFEGRARSGRGSRRMSCSNPTPWTPLIVGCPNVGPGARAARAGGPVRVIRSATATTKRPIETVGRRTAALGVRDEASRGIPTLLVDNDTTGGGGNGGVNKPATCLQNG